jgi:hypothetical protein
MVKLLGVDGISDFDGLYGGKHNKTGHCKN